MAASEVMGKRLPTQEYPGVFCDLNPPLDPVRARVEASRCYYCYDAPCIQACPTQIDIPSFIRKIGNGNVRGAAMDILSANIMGGTCARACPVETLCQKACVREKSEAKPVQIGQLQRFATDALFDATTKSGEQPFKRATPNGKKVAVVGAGPAGLSCAHRLALLGYEVTVFEAREKSGGLNEYGLAPYKMLDRFAQREVEFILGVGGIEVRHGQHMGRDFELSDLRADYDAVFLGIGLGDVNSLGVPGEDLSGVIDAVKQIAGIRQAKDLAEIPVGRHVVVIGGGNTAVDIAIQMKRLGAEFVTLVYRRGREHMGATEHEQELAQQNGVLLKPWAKPVRIIGAEGAIAEGATSESSRGGAGGAVVKSAGVHEVEFEYTEAGPDGKARGTGRLFRLRADQVFKAIGQRLVPTDAQPGSAREPSKAITLAGGKISVNQEFETALPGVFAGGDAVGPGEDLTVTAVQQGKLAAEAIHQKLGRPGDAAVLATGAKGSSHG